MIYTVMEINGAAQLIVADEWDETKHPRDEQGDLRDNLAAGAERSGSQICDVKKIYTISKRC